MQYFAHNREKPNGQIEWQMVQEHLLGTAEYAGACLRRVGLENTGYLAGLIHDLGKYTAAYQTYLSEGDQSKRGSVIHTFQGCRFLMEKFHRTEDIERLQTAELLAFAVGAHHGLFDCVDETQRIGLKYRSEKDNMGYEEAVSAFLTEVTGLEELERRFSLATEEVGKILGRIEEAYEADNEYSFEIGLMARLLLSAVIEGDRRDTAQFASYKVFLTWPEDMRPIWAGRLQHMERKLDEFSADTAVAKARCAISEQCKNFAQQPPGIYRLNVPTGGGKTLASLRYALTHAEAYNQKRLVFTSPLLSILEQNEKVLREFVGDDSLILEHHSNVVQTDMTKDELDEQELLTQTWDAPIIITTMFQLLNTLFDGRTSSIRRFHALCDSVIVIDEVQTVPTKLLTLFNLSIRYLSEQCGATIVLCSATQPCLELADHPLRETPPDIVPYNEEIWKAFKRTRLQPVDDTRLEALPGLIRDIMEDTDSLLVVCNKKDEAAYLLKETESPDYVSYHLSASMCMQHRRDVVEALQNALEDIQNAKKVNNTEKVEKVLCISTQVIEAGVDISFERVLRLTAGMDSVVQAAGRCNRNRESERQCSVYMVNCTDENLGMLQDIQRGKTASISLLEAFRREPERFENDLASEAAIARYYQSYYDEMDEGAQDYPVSALKTSLFDLLGYNTKYVDEDCAGAEDYVLWQAFKIAGQYFTVFEEDTIDVLSPYGKGKELIAELCSQRCAQDALYREKLLKAASDYTVSLYQYQKKQLEKNHGLRVICGGSVFVLAEEHYDETIGVRRRPKEELFLEV